MAGFFEAAANFDADSSPLRELVASSNDIGRADNDGMTLLHYACREGHLRAVGISLEDMQSAAQRSGRQRNAPKMAVPF